MGFCDLVRKCLVCGEPVRDPKARTLYHWDCYCVMKDFHKIEMVRLQRRARQIAIIKAASKIKEAKLKQPTQQSLHPQTNADGDCC